MSSVYLTVEFRKAVEPAQDVAAIREILQRLEVDQVVDQAG